MATPVVQSQGPEYSSNPDSPNCIPKSRDEENDWGKRRVDANTARSDSCEGNDGDLHQANARTVWLPLTNSSREGKKPQPSLDRGRSTRANHQPRSPRNCSGVLAKMRQAGNKPTWKYSPFEDRLQRGRRRCFPTMMFGENDGEAMYNLLNASLSKIR
jgi:hypothetical protein